MKKIFIGLLFLCAVCAAVLWWLITASPPTAPKLDNAKEETHSAAPAPDAPSAPLAAAGEGGMEAGDAEDAQGASDADMGPKLRITTEPVKAKVYVNGVAKGESPLEIAITEKHQEIRFEADGFEEYKKDAPSLADASGSTQMNWKIQLRAKKGALSESPRTHQVKEAAREAHAEETPPTPPVARAKPKPAVPAHDEPRVVKAPPAAKKTTPPATVPVSATADGVFLSGSAGPNFVQVQSLPRENAQHEADILSTIQTYREKTGKKIMGCPVSLGAKGNWVRILVGPFSTKSAAQKIAKDLQSNFPEPLLVTGVQKCQP